MVQFPFQWSIKLPTGEIYCVQTDTAEELGLAIEEVRTKLIPRFAVSNGITTSETVQPLPTSVLVCVTCGGKAEVKEGTSKNGHPYKIFRCLTHPELKVKGGHSYFM